MYEIKRASRANVSSLSIHLPTDYISNMGKIMYEAALRWTLALCGKHAAPSFIQMSPVQQRNKPRPAWSASKISTHNSTSPCKALNWPVKYLAITAIKGQKNFKRYASVTLTFTFHGVTNTWSNRPAPVQPFSLFSVQTQRCFCSEHWPCFKHRENDVLWQAG